MDLKPLLRNFKHVVTIRAYSLIFLSWSPNSKIYANNALTVKYISTTNIYSEFLHRHSKAPNNLSEKKFPSSVDLKLTQNKETPVNTYVIRKLREGQHRNTEVN